MKLYGEKKRQIEEMERLRKYQVPSHDVKKMREEERQLKLLEMQ
jgi:hypothetical protein